MASPLQPFLPEIRQRGLVDIVHMVQGHDSVTARMHIPEWMDEWMDGWVTAELTLASLVSFLWGKFLNWSVVKICLAGQRMWVQSFKRETASTG